jgi:hypothetical protein
MIGMVTNLVNRDVHFGCYNVEQGLRLLHSQSNELEKKVFKPVDTWITIKVDGTSPARLTLPAIYLHRQPQTRCTLQVSGPLRLTDDSRIPLK